MKLPTPSLLALSTALLLGPTVAAQDEEPEPKTVSELRREFSKEEDAEERTLLLLELANRAVSEPRKARSAWEAVALGLADESFSVRRQAIRLLLLAPEREPAVVHLCAALDDLAAGRGIEDFGRALQRRGRGAAGGGQDPGRRGRGAEAEQEEGEAEQEKKQQGENEEGGQQEGAGEEGAKEGDEKDAPDPFAGFRAALDDASGYVEELVDAVANLPDDRSVRSLEAFFDSARGRILSRYKLPAAQGLGTLGSRPAVEKLLESFYEQDEAWQEEQEAKERDRDSGNGGGRGRRAARGRLQQWLGGGADTEELREGLHAVLVSVAKKAEAEPVPALDEDAARSWRKWMSKHRRKLPSKLGKIQPLDEDED